METVLGLNFISPDRVILDVSYPGVRTYGAARMTPERALQRAGHKFPGQITSNLRDAGFAILDRDQLAQVRQEALDEFVKAIHELCKT